MLQETNENHFSKGADMLLLLALALLLAVPGAVLRAVAGTAYRGPVMLFVLLLLAGFVLWLYRQRLCTYRYTLYGGPEAGDEAYPAGTFTAERMLGDKPGAAIVISQADMLGFFGPGAAVGCIGGQEKPRLHAVVMTVAARRNAYSLCYGSGRRLCRLYLHPSPEMARRLTLACERGDAR